jgi:hypothetical protein
MNIGVLASSIYLILNILFPRIPVAGLVVKCPIFRDIEEVK